MATFCRSQFVCAAVVASTLGLFPSGFAQTCAPAPSDLVSWWQFEGDAADFQGMHPGVTAGGQFLPARVGAGYEPSGGSFQVPHAPGLVLTEVTIEAWVRLDGIGSRNAVVLFKGDNGGANVSTPYSLLVRKNTGVPFVILSNGTAQLVDASAALPFGVFTHVAVTIGTDVRIYIDGQIDTIQPLVVPPPFVGTTHPIHIGSLGASNALDGSIDELSLYGRALSAPEIAAIHSAGSAGKCTVVDAAPTAIAGPDQSIHAGAVVYLDGSASFDDNTASSQLNYTWSLIGRPPGSTASLALANTATPSFQADLPGHYTAALIVTDEVGNSSVPDTVTIASTNLAPTADAGADDGGVVGLAVPLDGSASTDPENDALGFQWSFVERPVGSAAVLMDAGTPTPRFVPDLVGVYSAQLIVDDGFEDSSPDVVEITVISGQEYAELQMLDALNLIGALPPTEVTTKGNRRALTNFLGQAIQSLQEGDLERARHKMNMAIERSDGCALRGSPDSNGPGRDWITACQSQLEAYDLMTRALAVIDP